jgi:hypothetical protein
MAAGTLKNIEVMAGDGSYAIRPADYVLAKALAASTAEGFTVPANATHVLLACSENFYANWTTTATVPGDVTDGTASELNPEMRICRGVTTISVITAAAGGAVITASFWRS